jgi:hypothetical protein
MVSIGFVNKLSRPAEFGGRPIFNLPVRIYEIQTPEYQKL